MVQTQSPTSLIRPSIEKIHQLASGRKHGKLRQDAQALLENLDSLCVVLPPHEVLSPRRGGAPGAAPTQQPQDGAGDAGGVEVQLQLSSEGGVVLALSPGKQAARRGAAVEAAASADPGHVPGSPGAQSAAPADSPSDRPGVLCDAGAKELLAFLREAAETRKPPVLELVLDCLQKLIAFKLLQGPVYNIGHKREAKKPEEGDEAVPPEPASLSLQAQALQLICGCDDVTDEGVELRLLKALLTAVTSPTLSVHGQALLLVVRACYNVYLTSRSEVNQTTAKATLTQMLNVVFQRMEAGSAHVVVPPIMVSDLLGLPPADSSNMSAFVQQFLYDVATAVDPFGYVAEGIRQGLDDAFVHDRPGSPLSIDEMYDPSDPTDKQHIAWRTGSSAAQGAPSADADDADAAAAAAAPSPGPESVPGGATTTSVASKTSGAPDAGPPSMEAQLQKDAFLVFRALCKLSIRSIDAAPASELMTVRGKVLALELLKILLENSGTIFQSAERFIAAIKQYLCLSLLKNCSSSVPQALRLCCSIFLTLMVRFRKHLKAEVGVFFPMILLRPIEAMAGSQGGAAAAGSIDMVHKAVVLRCLQSLCQDGQLLVDVFVNYDCDLEGANLFERMVTALVRIAQGSAGQEAQGTNSLEEQALRYEALRCLVSILQSLGAWHDATTEQRTAATGAAEADGTQAVAPELAEEVIKSSWMETLPASDRDAALGNADSEQKQAQMLESWKAYKRTFQEGVALFNRKPKSGIKFLQEQGLVGHGADEVAQFLVKSEGLNKTLIGDYLGEREDFNLKVMHSYVDGMNFTQLDFDEAIRKFLSGFRLPGEAQKIDRLMEKFAERFVSCNAEAFKSADVAYVLAYSVIMLNTDAHNPMVKNKMSKQDFLRNNRGINDGGDLPVDFMESLYDRIITNEIKMQDDPAVGPAAPAAAAQQASSGWLDTIMNLLPGRQKLTADEPNEESIQRTHAYLRQKAKGATFFEAQDSETIRPMLDVAWAPLLGAFSVLFEQYEDDYFVGLCLDGFVSAVRLTALLDMSMLRNTYVTSLARFTMLHSPAAMKAKHARAFRALLVVAEQNGNRLHECWQEVLRCVSRFELLQQLTARVPTDALLFAMPERGTADKLKRRILGKPGDKEPRDSVSSINDMGLHAIARGSGKDGGLPPALVTQSVDPQELNRLFVNSSKLDSEAIVEFVKTLCTIAQEELKPINCPRVFSLAKIVEIASFNMGRIRLVWSRIWAVLADFFVEVGCHSNLQVAMYGVDSLRQLAMKFLERDELANYTFQNDFLRPFVVVMRHSKALEIRELIIRCVSQMVLARVANVKSGWKSMFMVFTTAATDENPQIVRLAFDTIEKIVREHFHYITETETATFTDCVNCLIAFTNNPHSVDVSLNAIAFLRFCAMKLAEGDIGEVEELPEDAQSAINPNLYRIRPTGQDFNHVGGGEGEASSTAAGTSEGLVAATGAAATRIKFTDKDEHMYFWFPLLAGLSELTFDPRPQIRYTSIEVLFDILKYHGSSFNSGFWMRVFDSVLLPIFDHVRAEVIDTTTFTDEKRRAEVDSWLFETCTRTLQHIVDIVVQYYRVVSPLLDRILELLLSFTRRTHQSLAAVGVAAMVRLMVSAGPEMDNPTWLRVIAAFSQAAHDTLPNVGDLIQHRMERRTDSDVPAFDEGTEPVAASPREPAAEQAARAPSIWSLGEGAGARRLAEVSCRAAIQLLIVQACGEVYARSSGCMPTAAVVELLDILRLIAGHAADVDANVGLRHSLLLAQAADTVPIERALPDPPLLNLEAEASNAYLSTLLHILAAGNADAQRACNVEMRLVQLCMRNLERFEQQATGDGMAAESLGHQELHLDQNTVLAPLAVATLRALMSFSSDGFQSHLKEFFPLLTSLISCDHAPPEVQKVLSELFAKRIGPLVA